MKRRLSYILLTLCLAAFAAYAVPPHWLRVVTEAPTPRADQLFDHDDPNHSADVHRLAQQIEWGDPIAPDDVAWLGDRVNQNHGQDITLLFHALAAGNVPAVDALLAAGADPALPDKPGSPRDFVYALTMPGGDLLDQDGMNDILAVYLTRGGDPNGSGGIAPDTTTVLPYGLALHGNYDGLHLVLKAGADPWLAEWRDGARHSSAIEALAGDQAFAQLDALIDAGHFDNRTQSQLEHFLTALGGYAQRGDGPSLDIKRIAMRVLKRNPHYVETSAHDARTRMIFKDHWQDPEPGVIPWGQVRSAH